MDVGFGELGGLELFACSPFAMGTSFHLRIEVLQLFFLFVLANSAGRNM